MQQKTTPVIKLHNVFRFKLFLSEFDMLSDIFIQWNCTFMLIFKINVSSYSEKIGSTDKESGGDLTASA